MQTLIENINTTPLRGFHSYRRFRSHSYSSSIWGFERGSLEWWLIILALSIGQFMFSFSVIYSMIKSRGASFKHLLWSILGVIGMAIALAILWKRPRVDEKKATQQLPSNWKTSQDNNYNNFNPQQNVPSNWLSANGTTQTISTNANSFVNVKNTQLRELELLRLKDAGVISESEYLELSKGDK